MRKNDRMGARLSLRDEVQRLVGRNVRFQIREGRSSREIFGILVACNDSGFKVSLNGGVSSIIIPRNIVYDILCSDCLNESA